LFALFQQGGTVQGDELAAVKITVVVPAGQPPPSSAALFENVPGGNALMGDCAEISDGKSASTNASALINAPNI
jgi:hypothetical protein